MPELPTESASPFARTEIPEPLRFQFLKPKDGGPVELENFTVKMEIVKPDGTVEDKPADIDYAPEGRIKYEFAEGDLDQEGQYSFQFRVESGDNPVVTRFYSSVIELVVYNTPKDEAQA